MWDPGCLISQGIATGTVVVFDVKVPKVSQTLAITQEVRAGTIALNMVEKSRDLSELSVALEAEEWVRIGEAIAVEAVFRAFKGEGADPVFLHASTGFEVLKES